METQVATISTDNYEVMANVMGMGKPSATESSLSIPRMKISHQPIMDMVETKGKKRQMEVVPGGTFAITGNDGDVSYCESVKFRPFLQRFRYTRWVPYTTPDQYGKKGKFIRSVLVTQDNFNNSDHMDDDGGFNCGRPSGYIKDWKALPESTRRLISSVKRVRTLFGIVSSDEAMNEKGETLDTPMEAPVIWEIGNKDAFKVMGEAIGRYFSAKRLLPDHVMDITTKGAPMANGNMLYSPIPVVDLSTKIEISETDQETFGNFVSWVDGQNDYVTNKYKEKNSGGSFSQDDSSLIEEFVTVLEDV